jgi:metal-dependent hydrolase (beta-lactamase superfamily II)
LPRQAEFCGTNPCPVEGIIDLSAFGDFHLVDVSDAEVTQMTISFRDKWKIEHMSPGHCTGQFAFSEFMRKAITIE